MLIIWILLVDWFTYTLFVSPHDNIISIRTEVFPILFTAKFPLLEQCVALVGR